MEDKITNGRLQIANGRLQNSRGLTLLELLISAAIISIIAPAIFILFSSGMKSYTHIRSEIKAHREMVNKRDVFLETVRLAKEVVYLDNRTLELWVEDSDHSGYPDRDETVIFEWSGVSGDPLYRNENYERTVFIRNIELFEVVPDYYPPRTNSVIVKWKQGKENYFYSTGTLRNKIYR